MAKDGCDLNKAWSSWRFVWEEAWARGFPTLYLNWRQREQYRWREQHRSWSCSEGPNIQSKMQPAMSLLSLQLITRARYNYWGPKIHIWGRDGIKKPSVHLWLPHWKLLQWSLKLGNLWLAVLIWSSPHAWQMELTLRESCWSSWPTRWWADKTFSWTQRWASYQKWARRSIWHTKGSQWWIGRTASGRVLRTDSVWTSQELPVP